MAKTKSPALSTDALKPYVQRAMTDPELREDLLAAFVAARQMAIRNVLVVTDSGGAARLMREYPPEAALRALTTTDGTSRLLAL